MAGKADRLSRVLLIVAYVRRNKGAKVDQVARAVGLDEDDVKDAVDQLQLCGRPPFSPDNLIDIYRDANDRVEVHLDQSLGRPMRFTKQEALALSIALKMMMESGAGEYAGAAEAALGKLRAAMPEGASPGQDPLFAQFAVESEDRELEGRFRVLVEGFRERRAVDLAYFTASRNELTQRRVHPYGLVSFLGSWYVVGYCELRQEVRIFKLERVRSATATEVPFTLPEGFDSRRYAETGMLPSPEREAKVRFRPPHVQAILDELEGETIERCDDGSIVLTLDYASDDWLAGWVMSFGAGAELLEPADVRERLFRRCRETLKRYA